MKIFQKLPLCMVVLTFFLGSCSNENIEISRSTVITVRPSGITKPFTYQVYDGDLQSFSDGYKLRTRLLIYDNQGKLVEEHTQLLDNYNHDMRVENLVLAEGKYKLIAIADAAQGSDEYWKLSGQETLDHLRLDYTRKEAYSSTARAILGIGRQDISIPQSNDVIVEMQPAGSLVITNYKNIHNAFNIVNYGTMTDWIPGHVSFDLAGAFTLSADRPANIVMQPNYGHIDFFRTDDKTGTDVASYFFTFPASGGKTNYAITYTLQGESNPKAKVLQDCDMQIGGEYCIEIDFASASNIKDVKPTWSKKN